LIEHAAISGFPSAAAAAAKRAAFRDINFSLEMCSPRARAGQERFNCFYIRRMKRLGRALNPFGGYRCIAGVSMYRRSHDGLRFVIKRII